MPDLPIVPTFGLPISLEDLTSTQEFHNWMSDVTENIEFLTPAFGSGTPEGALEASPGKFYIDTAAAAGTGLYVKETGDGDTGWVARS